MMHRIVSGAFLVIGVLACVGCGSVRGMVDANGSGSESGGSACTTNDQCAAPTPICDPGNGCVECLQSDQCPAEKPTCDTAMHTCRACAMDADCASDVCDPDSGMCVAEGSVLYTSQSGPDSGACPKSAPCSLLQASALADQTRNNIKLAAGTYSAHIILTNKTLVFFGVGATIAGQGTNSVFEVNDGGSLRIVGATVTAATGNTAIRCEGGAAATHVLQLFRATVVNNSTTLLANPCTLTVNESVFRNTSTTAFQVLIVGPSVATFDRSRFVGAGAGLAGLANANIQIANSMFTKVGADPAAHGAFIGGNFNVSFSTVVDGIVECSASGATGLTLTSSIVRNTIAGGPPDTLQGVNACTSVKYSVVFPNSAPLGATNLIADPQLKNIAADDYHLLLTSPALDHGDPASTNAVDFDGTVRPQGAGRDSGAFEFKP